MLLILLAVPKARNKLLEVVDSGRASSLPPAPIFTATSTPPRPSPIARAESQTPLRRRPLPQIDDVFLSNSSPASSSNRKVSPGTKRPPEDELSPASSKKPALQPQAPTTSVKTGSRRVSSGNKNRKVPLSKSESANSQFSDASSLHETLHEEMDSQRKAVLQLKSDVSSMRQKLLVNADVTSSPGGLPRSPVTRSLKSKLREDLPANFDAWMKDVDDRLDALLNKLLETQTRPINTPRPSSEQGIQTDPISKSPLKPDINLTLKMQAVGLIRERDQLKAQISQLDLEINEAYANFDEELGRAYDKAEQTDSDLQRTLIADLQMHQGAHYKALADNA